MTPPTPYERYSHVFLQHLLFCLQSSKKDNASEEAGDTANSEKADAEGSSDEDEGALVIDEKNERGGTKRKAEESTEVSVFLLLVCLSQSVPICILSCSCQIFVRHQPRG